MTEKAVRSGLVAVVGRPNVGKSTLVNKMVGEKVSIISPTPNTTRFEVRGVLQRPDAQAVFLDTPGLHRPRTPLGARLNQTARGALEGIDAALVVVDATEAIGPGDRLSLSQAAASRAPMLVAVNKTDRARPQDVLERLASLATTLELSAESETELFPVSATRGEGVEALVDAVVSRLPEGPPLYPNDMVSDQSQAVWLAEQVREQLLRRARDELPHSIACRVTEWEGSFVRCEVLVERESQKGIVIGRRGEVLKEVGSAVRRQLPEGTYLELVVKVDRRWQHRPEVLDRLGL